MNKNLEIKEYEQIIIDYAKEKNLDPQLMLSAAQTALLNIAGWICECFRYSNDEYEKFMRDYANNVVESVNNRFRKE